MRYPDTTPTATIIAKINSITDGNNKMLEVIADGEATILQLKAQLKERGHVDTTIKKVKMYE